MKFAVWVLALFVCAATAWGFLRKAKDDGGCGAGFHFRASRCIAEPPCPSPLVDVLGACRAPAVRVRVEYTHLLVGPSDWEAEGRVQPRHIDVGPFAIDAFEATDSNLARALSNIAATEASALCSSRGGRLPTEDEWIAAAASARGFRYPWGDTGAVCRRAAWGLLRGPCARGTSGPDTVGAHPDGDTPSGIHDMAGNVAEWVTVKGGGFVAKGGSWASDLAAEIRVWSGFELPEGARDERVGFRCIYEIRPE